MTGQRRQRVLRVVVVLVLLGGGVLTLARLWQPAAGPLQETMIRLAALVPLAVLPYAVAALGAALLVRRWRPAAALLVLAVAGLALHLWWLTPAFTDDGPAAADGPRLRVLTVNALAYTGASGADLVRLARGADADVVVVEELTGEAYEQALRAGLVAAYAHRSWSPDAGDTATMIWSHLPMSRLRTLPRASGVLSATLRWEGRDVDLLGVHTGPPVWPHTWREDHADLLRAVRRERPDLLAGDFNATTDHLPLRRLLGEGLRDAVDLTGSGWAPTWPSHGRQHLLGVPLPRFAAIDHVLVGRGWTVTSLRRVEVPRSDHTAVLAVVAPVA
ncbi:endonuclease/exonuclease/phosphatase family protein [Nocardioides marmoribigeumensis]|uniref:Endonuclease/exonuclease/phosphatase (EEP) superfamily protein YafD n=1 Tax=Nocardioides marmoribigeumensis TaxID=433649 RepID=A0ABU2BS81_9ACTN|nr:endonuclease/exonuclease/phosphatase family protein [Nocardioides marmoribigeumensis]MDR7361131.1 endonuclease/exonuclease/phosphatase (EEP) superfamily protein YafD [Nocardioides marmoribigeumensis]